MAKVKLVSFDIGNTLIYSDGHGFCRKFREATGTPKETVIPLIREYFLSKDSSVEEAVRIVSSKLGWDGADGFLSTYTKPTPTTFEDAYPCIRMLQKEQLRVVATSNCTPWESGGLDSKMTDAISKIFYSFSVGHVKPDKAIFNHVRSQCRVNSNEIVHIGDDWEKDIIGALDCGWKTIYLDRDNKSTSAQRQISPVENNLVNVAHRILEM